MGNRVAVRMLDVVRPNAGLQIRYYISVPMAAKGAMAFNIVALIAYTLNQICLFITKGDALRQR